MIRDLEVCDEGGLGEEEKALLLAVVEDLQAKSARLQAQYHSLKVEYESLQVCLRMKRALADDLEKRLKRIGQP